MNMTEKNGQPSMEEILASIRRIIAEEPAISHSNGELRGTPITLKGDGVLDDTGDFDLPAIFRSSPPPQIDKPAPLLGRLTDAIRSATAAQSESRGHINGGAIGEDYGAHAEAESPGENGYPALSSLKPVRPGDGAAEPLHGGVALPAPDVPHYTPQPQPAPYIAASKPGAPEEPRRVMAPFKDTHFLQMGGAPAALPSPEPAAAPAAATPPPQAPKVDFGAIIPGQLDRSALLSAEAARTPPPSAAAPAPPSQVAASGPPPLGAAEHRDGAGVIPFAPLPPPLAADASAAAPAGDGSIEDATADLLRPMLRQWLADNMPRMVEKALHIEIAETVKKKP